MRRESVTTPMTGSGDGRWYAVAVVAVAVGFAGLVGRRFPLVAFGAVTLGLAVLPLLADPPAASLALERDLDGLSDGSGDPVTVTATVQNTGETTLYGVRVAEGVPDSLLLLDGSTLTTGVLAPGETVTVTYAVGVTPGTHQYGPTRVTARDWSGRYEVETALFVGTELVWSGDELTPTAGAERRDDGGGEPASSPEDRTGEAVASDSGNPGATVVCVDARPSSCRAGWTAVADTLVDCALTARHDLPDPVVLAVVDETGTCHVLTDDEVSAAEWLGRHVVPEELPTGVWSAARRGALPSASELVDDLAALLPAESRVYLVREVLDDAAVQLANGLAGAGFDVTVLHPRAFSGENSEVPSSLRGADVGVVEWSPDTSLRHARE